MIDGTQNFQRALTKEWPLNHTRVPTIVYNTFLNQGLFEALGTPPNPKRGANKASLRVA